MRLREMCLNNRPRRLAAYPEPVRNLPWWFKLASKLVASALLPISYECLRQKVTGFRGKMADTRYAKEIFAAHWQRYLRYGGSIPQGDYLELGPGGSLCSAVLARSCGFENAVLVDVGDFAIKDRRYYQDLMKKVGRDVSFNDPVSPSFESFLAHLRIRYLTRGLDSLKSLPSSSVWFSSSQDVLEHVRKEQFRETVAELSRIHKPGSLSSHRIDFQDHLGASLNHLRFSSRFWESYFFQNSGFYTNRLRYSDVKRAFGEAGFEFLDERLETWEKLPLSRNRLAPEFRHYTDEDLLVRIAEITVRKKTND